MGLCHSSESDDIIHNNKDNIGSPTIKIPRRITISSTLSPREYGRCVIRSGKYVGHTIDYVWLKHDGIKVLADIRGDPQTTAFMKTAIKEYALSQLGDIAYLVQ